MPTRRAFLAGTAGAALLPLPAFGAPPVESSVDSRVEFLGGVARVAGFEEYGAAGLPAWFEPLDRGFKAARGGPAVRALQSAREHLGLGFDALPSLAVHLVGEPGALTLTDPLSPWPAGLDRRWEGVDLPRFVVALNRAAKITKFTELWASLAPEREDAARAAGAAAAELDLAWFESWFGFPAPGTVRVVASPVSAPYNYGARRLGRSPELLAVLGAAADPETGGLRVAGTDILLHEVGHSFVNPVLAENARFLSGPGGRLYQAVRLRMERLHYGDWAIVTNETVLRAVVVRYLLTHGGPSAARSENARQIGEGFPWTLVLADALSDYESNRDRYPTFGDYAVPLAAVLGVIAEEEEARAAGRPRVVSVAPDASRPVPADTPALVVTFSHRMHPRSWSVVGIPSETPESDPPSFDASGTTFTLPWRLEAGRTYRFSLNDVNHQNFVSEAGVPLEPVPLSFSVAPNAP